MEGHLCCDMMKTSMISEPAPHSDETLVNRSHKGDRDAFGQIVTRYQSLICSLANGSTLNLSPRPIPTVSSITLPA